MTNLPRTETLDRGALQSRLADADLAVLLIVLVQLTGDMSQLERFGPQLGKPGEFQHHLPPELADELLERLAEVLERGGAAPKRSSAVTGRGLP